MRHLTGRQIALVLAAVLAVATLAIGAYGLVRGASSSTPASDPGREEKSSRAGDRHFRSQPR